MGIAAEFRNAEVEPVVVLKSVWSRYLLRVVKAGEEVDTMTAEAARWFESGYAKTPDPPELDQEFCERLIGDDDHQCSRKRGHGPEGRYCKQHAGAALDDIRAEASPVDAGEEND